LKRKQGESTAQIEEVTDEEAERIMKEEAEKKKKQQEGVNATEPTDAQAAADGEESKEENKEDKGQVPTPGNGGVTDTYRWQQTLEETTVFISLPDNTVSKQLDVKIMPTKLKVGIKGQPPIIDGEFPKKIKIDDSIWTLEQDGVKRVLQLNLSKVDAMTWWDCVIKGDPKIDT
jgi:hypothetical protein